MEPEDQAGPGEALDAQRLRRAIARRFPRTRRLYNWLRIQGFHYLKLGLGMFRPRRAIATARWLAAVVGTIRERQNNRRLTVGVDVTALWEPLTGVGWYLYRLLEVLADEPRIHLRLYGPTVVDSPDRVDPYMPLPIGSSLEWILHDIPDGLLLPRGLIIRLLRRFEPLLIAADGNEVMFGPNYFLPRRFLFAGDARVVTVHDLGFRTVPWTLQEETLRELTKKLERSITEANRVITVSQAIKDELVEYGYATADRVQVVHHGPGHLSDVDPGALPSEVPERFALHIGTLEPRKNIPMLLAAWRHLRQAGRVPDLVFCGRYGWKTDALKADMESAAAEGWVHHLGYVSEEELAALYKRAALVVFPSLYEGFGLPAVEAFWAGTPLVCSDIAALREVAGGAALYAPPDRPDLFAERVAEVLASTETRNRMAQAGAERASSLSWRRSGEITVDVWRRAAGRKGDA